MLNTQLDLVSSAGPAPITLGGCSRFALYGFAGVAGNGDQTVVYGDIGGHNAITGFGPAPLSRVADMSLYNYYTTPAPAADLCNTDLLTAYNQAMNTTCNNLLPNTDLSGLTLAPGVYCTTAGFFRLTAGSLTLSGPGDNTGVWLFQTATDVITSTKTQIVLSNGAVPANVFWQVGSSAQLAGTSKFVGTIMAAASVNMGTNVQLIGRALAKTASMTMAGQDSVVLPDPNVIRSVNNTGGFHDFAANAAHSSSSQSVLAMGAAAGMTLLVGLVMNTMTL